MFGRFRPGSLGNCGIRKNALRACSATRCVIRLVCGDGVPEFLRENIGEIGASHRARKRASPVDEIACPVGERRDGNQPGVDALVRPGSLIVGEEEHLALLDRSTHSATELVLPVKATLRRKVITCIESGVSQKLEGTAM